jgi:RNA polymerase sigma-70 factor (ECF subfamily)
LLPINSDESLDAATFLARRPARPATIYSAMAREDETQQRVNWPVVLAEHGRWLRTVVLARVADHAAADDVMQDVATAAIEKGHQLRDPAKVGPWLYRLAVMAALQYRRRLARRRRIAERYAVEASPVDYDTREADPLDWLLADERNAMVRQALRCLPRRDAEILLLKYTEDWSYRELSQHLGLSTSAVEARLHRARQKMRRALAQLDPTLKQMSHKASC